MDLDAMRVSRAAEKTSGGSNCVEEEGPQAVKVLRVPIGEWRKAQPEDISGKAPDRKWCLTLR